MVGLSPVCVNTSAWKRQNSDLFKRPGVVRHHPTFTDMMLSNVLTHVLVCTRREVGRAGAKGTSTLPLYRIYISTCVFTHRLVQIKRKPL